jgi:hypothetical protein
MRRRCQRGLAKKEGPDSTRTAPVEVAPPSAIQDANQTLARLSKACGGNKTKEETGFASRTLKRDTKIEASSPDAHRTLKFGADFLLGPTLGQTKSVCGGGIAKSGTTIVPSTNC